MKHLEPSSRKRDSSLAELQLARNDMIGMVIKINDPVISILYTGDRPVAPTINLFKF